MGASGNRVKKHSRTLSKSNYYSKNKIIIMYNFHNISHMTLFFFFRFEFGAAIFIAWGGSFLDVLGGAMLAASCPRSKQVSKYPKSNPARSASSSNKEYV